MATSQRSSGGRIDALQDLAKDGVSLNGLDASKATLDGIKLQNTILYRANFDVSNINNADLSGSDLRYAIFTNSNLTNTKFNNAFFGSAGLIGVDFRGASLNNADLSNALLGCDKQYRNCTNFKNVKGITPEQIQKARGWQDACYDSWFRQRLKLPPKNPKSCGSENYDQ